MGDEYREGGHEGGLSHTITGNLPISGFFWSSHANCLLTGSMFSVPGRLRHSLCVLDDDMLRGLDQGGSLVGSERT
jgi:hypothetical protein